MPNGTLLASTFNEELSTELYEWEGLELRKNKIDSLLGPGMNIHRNPLNGRNFEYFSEDPLLTGKMAAAQLRGMHKYNVTGTIKHFACNNQETNRHGVEAVVSERALREIYLKGFEIAVKEGGAYSIGKVIEELPPWIPGSLCWDTSSGAALPPPATGSPLPTWVMRRCACWPRARPAGWWPSGGELCGL
mgnify:CR=1 FL=1